MAILIGLTGGIATGKSTVSNMFKAENIPVVDADAIAKDVVDNDPEAYEAILEAFGEDVLSTDNTINRNKLAKRIFDDAEARKTLNAIVHPKVIDRIATEVERLRKLNHDLIVVDAPLLFEAGLDKTVDVTVFVYARQKDQLERITNRDGIDEAYALKKIKAQFPLSKKRELADYTIDNSKSILDTKRAFTRTLEAIKRKAASS